MSYTYDIYFLKSHIPISFEILLMKIGIKEQFSEI
jgi:hypothetical protein